MTLASDKYIYSRCKVGVKNKRELTKEFVSAHSAIPAFFLYNGASIPKFLFFIVTRWGEFESVFLEHDWMYDKLDTRNYDRKFCDKIMYYGLRKLGMSVIRAKLIYYSVRLFGIIGYKK